MGTCPKCSNKETRINRVGELGKEEEKMKLGTWGPKGLTLGPSRW